MDLRFTAEEHAFRDELRAWLVDVLDEIENLVVPDDLSQAFNKNKRARENFSAFNASARKVILLWIKTAKRDETRLKRVSETVRLAAKNLKAAHPEARGR